MIYGTRLWENNHSKSELRQDLEDNGFKCTYLNWTDHSFKKNIWACAFSTTESKEGRLYYKKPTHGYSNGNNFRYYLKNNNLSKTSVSLDARIYADTEDECIRLYNYLINRENARLQQLIDDNNKLRV